MARLFGGQRMVLQAVYDLPKNNAGSVTDAEIAHSTQLAVTDVRDWIETLEGEGLIDVARTTAGLSVLLTASGRQVLRQFEPFGSSPPAQQVLSGASKATPETSQVRTILFLAVDINETGRYHLEREANEIEKRLERAKKEDFRFVREWAATAHDLRRVLLEHEPTIVHLSGRGAGGDGLAFKDDEGGTRLVSVAALATLFKLVSRHVECVILDSCYSEMQARAIAKHIGYVVGVKSEIGVWSATDYAVGFYEALAAGRSYEEAHEFGRSAIDRELIPDYLTPVLKKKPSPKTTRGRKAVERANPSDLVPELSYYLYVSDIKIKNLLEQIGLLIENRYSALRAIAAKLIESDFLGDYTSDKPYLSGRLPLRWGLLSGAVEPFYEDLDDPSGPPANREPSIVGSMCVFFSLTTNPIILLIGSDYHLLDRQTKKRQIFYRYSGAPDMLNVLRLVNDRSHDMGTNSLKDDQELILDFLADQIIGQDVIDRGEVFREKGVYTEQQMKFLAIKLLEFNSYESALARSQYHQHYSFFLEGGVGKRILLGTPLFVSLD